MAAALGGNCVRAVVSQTTSRKMWNKLYQRCTERNVSSQIILLTHLLAVLFTTKQSMSNNVVELESNSNRLAAMDITCNELFKVALLLLMVTEHKNYAMDISALESFRRQEVSWDYVMMNLRLYKRKRMRH